MINEQIKEVQTVPTADLPQPEFVLRNRRHRLDLIFLDFALLNLAFAGTLWWMTDFFVASRQHALPLFGFWMLLNAIWIGVGLYFKIYKWKERAPIEREWRSVAKAIGTHGLVLFFIYHNLFPHFLPDYFFVVLYVLAIPLIIGSRLITRRIEHKRIKPINYIIVGGRYRNIADIKKAYSYRYAKKANCLGRFGNSEIPGIKNIGSYDDLQHFLCTKPVNKVSYIYSRLTEAHVHDIMKICQRRFIEFEIIPREHNLFPRGTNVERYGDLPVLVLKDEPLNRLRNKFLKRSFDLVFSSLVLLLIFPFILPVVAILIKMESPGPVFFIQKRTGYFNKPFRCYKFRTMKVNADSDRKQATKNDNRITKIGAFLRKTNLDEFPQFFNVFLGHMSVVGPRPHMLAHTEDYARLIDDFMIRHQVKPGITGWAQINGYRGPTETVEKMAKRVEYDVWYIENWGFLLDIKCIIRTMTNMFKGEENAF